MPCLFRVQASAFDASPHTINSLFCQNLYRVGRQLALHSGKFYCTCLFSRQILVCLSSNYVTLLGLNVLIFLIGPSALLSNVLLIFAGLTSRMLVFNRRPSDLPFRWY